jgi:hypothetical protein
MINLAYGAVVRFMHYQVVSLQFNLKKNFADGSVGPTISLASVATGAGEDDDQSDSDYGMNVD